MAAASLQGFRQTVTVSWPAHQDANAKRHLVKVARDGHARIMADAKSRGSDPQWEAYANQPGNTNLESVVLPGPIVFKYRYLGEIIKEALTALQKASPVRSGLYAKSHIVLVNGVAVDNVPKVLKSGDVVTITNPVPYARRLEIGKTEAGRDFVIQVPNRIYERVAKKMLNPKYRKVAKITFAYVALADSYATKGGGRGSAHKSRRKAGSKVMAPALIIEALT